MTEIRLTDYDPVEYARQLSTQRREHWGLYFNGRLADVSPIELDIARRACSLCEAGKVVVRHVWLRRDEHGEPVGWLVKNIEIVPERAK